LTTDLEPVTAGTMRLAITMGQWERRGPRSPWREGSFGQGIDTVAAFARKLEPEQRSALKRLCELWRKWHLNDMNAGTEAQQAALASMPKEDGGDWYGRACTHLAGCDLLTDRGYKFGSKWLVRALPAEVVSELETLCATLGGKL
jgi:hypothetical protein